MNFPCSYQFSKKATLNNDIMDKAGVQMKKPEEVTLETEYEKIKGIDIENWENVRGKSLNRKMLVSTSQLLHPSPFTKVYSFTGPRPWEDTVKN